MPSTRPLTFSTAVPLARDAVLLRRPARASSAAVPQRSRRRPVVASARRRRDENVDGLFYVDSSCIDCDTCRWLTPEVFESRNGQSAVHAQPSSVDGTRRALAAAVACPTGSIRTETPVAAAKEAPSVFPLAVNDEKTVFYAGYASKDTFGASSWLLITPDVNILFDVPRYNSGLAKRIETVIAEHGRPGSTLDFIALSHRDDVAGHENWAKRFPSAQRIIHETEVRPYQKTDQCEIKLSIGMNGEKDRTQLAPGVELIHVPGHSFGSVAMLDHRSRSIFTGDHLAFSSRTGDFSIFPRYNSHSLDVQRESVRKLLDEPFLHLYPGHGRMFHFQNDEDRRKRLETSVLAETVSR